MRKVRIKDKEMNSVRNMFHSLMREEVFEMKQNKCQAFFLESSQSNSQQNS